MEDSFYRLKVNDLFSKLQIIAAIFLILRDKKSALKNFMCLIGRVGYIKKARSQIDTVP